MIEDLSRLLELQVQDREADQLRRRAEAIPKETAKVLGDVETVKAEVALRKKELEASQKRRRDAEHEVGRLDGEIQKLQGQQFLLKTNKDFAAMTREIDLLKEKRSDLETQVILLLDSEDEFVGAVRRAEKEFEAVTAKASAETSRLDSTLAGIRADLERVLEARARLTEKLAPELRSRYERIREGKHGIAVVPVVKGSCGGCFTALPPQRINDVRLGAKVLACEGCGRLLVWSGDGAEVI
jgi:predicted  nucleic acid-binding Zn-ribbon protein